MRCFICDKSLSEPTFNRDHDDYDPCDTCLAVIYDMNSGFRDKPSADEHELGEDPTYEGLCPVALPANDNETEENT